MPDMRRYCTRAGELLARERGATDQLCAGQKQLHSHPHLQHLFMAAMRETLCWHILHDAELAEVCLQQQLLPNQLLLYTDLSLIPYSSSQLHSPQETKREQRRWSRVISNCLGDLGWSKTRKRNLKPTPELLRCKAGAWHLPRILYWYKGRTFTPCYRSCSKLEEHQNLTVEQGTCLCGRKGQWSLSSSVLSLYY